VMIKHGVFIPDEFSLPIRDEYQREMDDNE
jgi:hypothetical protein